MKNKNGFTLVELLAVVVIMGIIIGISIPAVSAVQKRLVNQRVTTFYRVVDEAADAYVEQYHTGFEKKVQCFEIPYDNLIKEGLLTETDITCLSEAYSGIEGKVIAQRVGDYNTFTYSYYLNCYDKSSNKSLAKSAEIPRGCLGVNGGYSVEVTPIHVEKNEEYRSGDWITGSVRFDVIASNPYFHALSQIQYQEENSLEWISNKSTITDSSPNGRGYVLFAPAKNSTDSTLASYSGKLKIRSVDAGGNLSNDSEYFTVKIDNTVPVPVINGVPGNWSNAETLTLTFTTNNTVPSGIRTYQIDLDANGSIDAEVSGTTPTYSITEDFNRSIRIKAISNTGIESNWSATSTVRRDKTAPKCTSSGGNTNWTNGNITLTGTCEDQGTIKSGCVSNITKAYTNNFSSTNESPGQVCDVAGNCVTCSNNQTVKIDKSAPTCTNSTSHAGWTNTAVTLTGTCTETGSVQSGCQGNAVRVISGQQHIYNQSPGQVCDNANNCTPCNADIEVKIDTSAPTCTVAGVGDELSGWTMTAICSDTGGSSCSSANQQAASQTSNKTFTFTDGAGNSGSCTGRVTSTTYHRSRTRTCSYYYRCAAAGCNTRARCAAAGCATWGDWIDIADALSYQECQSFTGTDTNSRQYRCRGAGAAYRPQYRDCSQFNRGSACSCEIYNRGSSCGCESFNAWSGWSAWSTNDCSETSYVDCDSQVRYTFYYP